MLASSAASCSRPCTGPLSATLPQGPNFKASATPTQYESSLERPITAHFTGAPRWLCALHAPRRTTSAGICPAPRPGQHPAAHIRSHGSALRRAMPHAPDGAGNYVRVKKVAAYQFTLAPESAVACNASLAAAWRAATGFDEAAYQGG